MTSLSDRLVSCISYATYGIFGVIYLVYAHVTRKNINSFVRFNIFQSFFIVAILALFAYAMNIILKFLQAFGLLGDIIRGFNLFFNGTPIYFGYTISGLIVTILVFYLVLFSFLGKRPFVPYISPIIESVVGG